MARYASCRSVVALSVIGPPPLGEMVLREAMELAIEHREELVARRAVPGLGGLHERADVRARRLCHGRGRLPLCCSRGSCTLA